MPKRSSKDAEPETDDAEARRTAAKLLGSLGGKKGGPARAASLSATRRKAIAKKAAEARWKSRKS